MTVSNADLTVTGSRVMIGLGSNMSNPVGQIRAALREIDELPGCALVRTSSLYESAPVGVIEQPVFINAVAEVETTLTPHTLMASLLAIERGHDRVRSVRNGPRTLDLDVLLFADLCIHDGDLVTPHPRAHERAFVLLPLLELAPNLVIPGKGPAREFLPLVGSQSIRKIPETELQPVP